MRRSLTAATPRSDPRSLCRRATIGLLGRASAAECENGRVRVRPLDETTWPDFARLVERHNGVWGGCWCMGFHAEGVGRTKTAAQNRSEKEASRPGGPRARRPRVRRRDLRGLVPVRADRRAAAHQAPARVPRRSRRPSGLADHVLLRRPRLPAQRGRLRRARRCSGRDRAARGRHGGELSRGRRRPVGLRVRSSTTARCRCSSATASSGRAASASITGWCSRVGALQPRRAAHAALSRTASACAVTHCSKVRGFCRPRR